MALTSQLAIAGGPPAVPAGAHRPWPQITDADRAAILAVLERGTLCGATAPEVSALEREWAEYVGARHCLATNSGTAALHCAAAAVGLEPGDEVVVPALTFIASPMAMIHQGAVPVFADIDPATYNLDPERIAERVTDRTRAILAVHLHGLPADMAAIRAVAARHGLAVIEDAAQAHGARIGARRVGTFGDCGIFSLNATKNLPGGEGGLFVTDDDAAARAARRLSVFGEDLVRLAPGELRSYTSHGVGWNYRTQELPAALTRSQLRRLDERNATGRANAGRLSAGLAQLPGLVPPHVPDGFTPIIHKYRLRLDAEALGWPGPKAELRDRLLYALRAEGVEAVLWQTAPLPAQPAFRRRLRPSGPGPDAEPTPWDPADYPATVDALDSTVIVGAETAPLLAQTPELMDRYVEAFAKVLGDLDTVFTAPYEPPRLV